MIRNLRRTNKFLHKKVSSLSTPPAKQCLTISKPITVDVLPCPTTKQMVFTKLYAIDVPPVEHYDRLGPEQAARARHPALDARDYPQHVLDDLDPDIRERKRKEHVATTLRMIDDALRYSN